MDKIDKKVGCLPQSLRRAKSAKPLRVSRLPLSPFGLEPLLTAQRTGGTSERKLAKNRQLFDFGMNECVQTHQNNH